MTLPRTKASLGVVVEGVPARLNKIFKDFFIVCKLNPYALYR